MDLIYDTIEKSWYKFDPIVTYACLKIMENLKYIEIEPAPGFNKCFIMQQELYRLKEEFEKTGKHQSQQSAVLQIPYYWYMQGVVVDPEYLMLITRGIIRFKWEEDCNGCQIQKECPCKGNPYNNDYELVLEKLKWLMN